MIVGEYDQSFGDVSQLLINDPVPVRIVQAVTSKGAPVGGVQFNVVDEDLETVLWAGVTDKNGIAVMPVKFNLPTASEQSHTNYIRTMLLPIGYANPTPRTVLTNVSYTEAKVDAHNIAQLFQDTSKLKPDITIKVDTAGAPSPRVELTDAQAKDKGLWNSNSNTILGGLAFRVSAQDGTLIRPDPNTPYFFNFAPFYWENNTTTSGTIDIDANGNIWVWTTYPMIGRLSLTPYFGGRPFPGGIGSSKPEWGISRVLASTRPYPYVYDIKQAPDGGLMPAGKITPDELVGAVSPKGPTGRSPAPSPAPAGVGVTSNKTPLYVLLAVAAIGATFAYFRLKED